MNTTRKHTKKEMGMIWSYENARYYSLNECYKNPSKAKLNAEWAIKHEMIAVNGYDFRITGRNCMVFSCAYRYINNVGDEILVYHTRDYCHVITL